MKYFVLILSLFSVPTSAFAVPITFTGAELAALPGASFPTGGQSIVGNSLRIDIRRITGILFRLDLNQFVVDSSNIGISVNTTRLRRDDGRQDQDIYIGIHDGQHFFSTFFVDNITPDIVVQNRVHAFSRSALTLSNIRFADIGPRTVFDVDTRPQLNLTVRATPSATLITSQVNQGQSFTSTSPVGLNRNAGLSLLFAGDQSGENYLINSLTFTSGVSFPAPPAPPAAVPEPSALGGLALGMMALGFGLYRRKWI